MNERVPDSTGLPLRAMVMVLLFLGVIFLLVGFQALGSGGTTDDDSSVSRVTTSAPAPKTSVKAAPKSDVLVFNISNSKG
ncbi:MAG: LytR family transcriptional regulator, partial [Mycobacterium sp.]